MISAINSRAFVWKLRNCFNFSAICWLRFIEINWFVFHSFNLCRNFTFIKKNAPVHWNRWDFSCIGSINSMYFSESLIIFNWKIFCFLWNPHHILIIIVFHSHFTKVVKQQKKIDFMETTATGVSQPLNTWIVRKYRNKRKFLAWKPFSWMVLYLYMKSYAQHKTQIYLRKFIVLYR